MNSFRQGMTLVEVMIFSVLLSLLLGGFIKYTYEMRAADAALSDEISQYEETLFDQE